MIYVSISVLALAAFLNAAALGEQYALKRATAGAACYRVGIIVVDLVLILVLFSQR